MLLSIMAARLRETLARLDGPVEGWREAAALDKQSLAISRRSSAPRRASATEAGDHHAGGQRGVALYVVLEGRVAMRIGDTVVEKAGPGGSSRTVAGRPHPGAWRPPWRKPAASPGGQPPHVPVPGETLPEIRRRPAPGRGRARAFMASQRPSSRAKAA